MAPSGLSEADQAEDVQGQWRVPYSEAGPAFPPERVGHPPQGRALLPRGHAHLLTLAGC